MSKNVAPKSAADAISLYAADGRRKYLNLVEWRRVLVAAREMEPDKALFIQLLAWTGARVSEVLALTPSSFQIEQGVVALKTLKRRRHSVREVPIPPALMRALDRRFRLRAEQLDSVQSNAPLWHWRRETAWRIVKGVMIDAGVSGPAASPRGLRHAFGVGTLQAGVPLNLVQRWLGHARMSTTAIYADVSGDEERAFASRFWKNAPSA